MLADLVSTKPKPGPSLRKAVNIERVVVASVKTGSAAVLLLKKRNGPKKNDPTVWYPGYEVIGLGMPIRFVPHPLEVEFEDRDAAIADGLARMRAWLTESGDPAKANAINPVVRLIDAFAQGIESWKKKLDAEKGRGGDAGKRDAKPVPVTVNAHGVAVKGFETLKPPMPAKSKITVKILVGWFASNGRSANGWRAQANFECSSVTVGPCGNGGGLSAKSGIPCETRGMAVRLEAENLLEYFEVEGSGKGASAPPKAKLFRVAEESLRRWIETFNATNASEPRPRVAASAGTALVPAFPVAKPPRNAYAADCMAVIDRAEKLSRDERCALKLAEAKIERGASAFLDMGVALREIKEKQLHREAFSTFDAYVWERWKIERSVAYRLIKFADLHASTSVIADKLHLRLTNEAQFRAIEKLSDKADLEAVLKRAAKEAPADADGVKVPTAKILAAAVRAEFTPAEDIDRQAAARREGNHRRLTASANAPAVADIIDLADREERNAAAHQPSTSEVLDAATNRPFFPHVETMEQACCYLRSWVSAMIRQFSPAELSDLDEELYGECLQLRKIYQPALQAAVAKQAARRNAK